MNDLSWFLYWADVAPAFSSRAARTCVIFAILYCIYVYARNMVAADATHPFDFPEKGDGLALNTKLVVFLIVMALASNIVPSKDTFYAIAASEMGETALNSDTGNKAVEALNAWLDRQIGETDKAE